MSSPADDSSMPPPTVLGGAVAVTAPDSLVLAVSVDGVAQPAAAGRSLFPVAAGRHTVECAGASATVEVASGKVVELYYVPPTGDAPTGALSFTKARTTANKTTWGLAGALVLMGVVLLVAVIGSFSLFFR